MPYERLREHGDVMVLRTTLPLKTGKRPGALICFCPDRMVRAPEVLFLANGFAANHKTFTFRPRISGGGYADSMADWLARWGYIVVVKDVGSERTEIEPAFEDHAQHVPHYAETALRVAEKELAPFCRAPVKFPAGVHWIGHSMGGMEVMAAANRSFIASFTAIGSPTYMATDEEHTMKLARLFGGGLGVRNRYKHIPASAGLLSKVADALFKSIGVESYRDLTDAQSAFVRALLGAPLVNMVTHNFLNLDHLDLETAVAFFRTGLSDETLYLMNEFAQALLRGESDKDRVLGHPISPIDVPTMVISGRGDVIAPTPSCENLLRFVNNTCKRSVSFEKYDHLGLLVRTGAEDHVWPHIVLFLHEQKLYKPGSKTSNARAARKTARFLLDNLALGFKARAYAREILDMSENIINKTGQAKKKKEL